MTHGIFSASNVKEGGIMDTATIIKTDGWFI